MGYYISSVLGLVSNTIKDRCPLNFVFRVGLLSVKNKVLTLSSNVAHINSETYGFWKTQELNQAHRERKALNNFREYSKLEKTTLSNNIFH